MQHRQEGDEAFLRQGKEVETSEDQVFDMDGEQLDRYLDWFEKTWTRDEGSRSGHWSPLGGKVALTLSSSATIARAVPDRSASANDAPGPWRPSR